MPTFPVSLTGLIITVETPVLDKTVNTSFSNPGLESGEKATEKERGDASSNGSGDVKSKDLRKRLYARRVKKKKGPPAPEDTLERSVSGDRRSPRKSRVSGTRRFRVGSIPQCQSLAKMLGSLECNSQETLSEGRSEKLDISSISSGTESTCSNSFECKSPGAIIVKCDGPPKLPQRASTPTRPARSILSLTPACQTEIVKTIGGRMRGYSCLSMDDTINSLKTFGENESESLWGLKPPSVGNL